MPSFGASKLCATYLERLQRCFIRGRSQDIQTLFSPMAERGLQRQAWMRLIPAPKKIPPLDHPAPDNVQWGEPYHIASSCVNKVAWKREERYSTLELTIKRTPSSTNQCSWLTSFWKVACPISVQPRYPPPSQVCNLASASCSRFDK